MPINVGSISSTYTLDLRQFRSNVQQVKQELRTLQRETSQTRRLDRASALADYRAGERDPTINPNRGVLEERLRGRRLELEQEQQRQAAKEAAKEAERLAKERERAVKAQQQAAEKAARERQRATEQAAREAERRRKAELDYQLAIADSAGKLALLRERLREVEQGSVDYYRVLTRIAKAEQGVAKEQERAAKAQRDQLRARLDLRALLLDDARQRILERREAAAASRIQSLRGASPDMRALARIRLAEIQNDQATRRFEIGDLSRRAGVASPVPPATLADVDTARLLPNLTVAPRVQVPPAQVAVYIDGQQVAAQIVTRYSGAVMDAMTSDLETAISGGIGGERGMR